MALRRLMQGNPRHNDDQLLAPYLFSAAIKVFIDNLNTNIHWLAS